ncbi:glycosyltransferase family 2 protein [Paenibacillus sp. WC2504]|uniref:glycosyltransferase family 2 protein n=1 Tax=Paenibacillus sp. WC2504 TaxID=3461403 RepID=UPI0040456E5E
MRTLIIIPAYNEEKNIGDLLHKILETELDNFDILVVNDKSLDSTSEICSHFNVKVIDLPCNLGIGGAVQTGYKYARKYGYQIAIQVDGDGQHDPNYLKTIIELLQSKKADMIIGSRYIEKQGFQSSVLRRVGIRYFSKLIKLLIKEKITDPTSGYRGCNSNVIEILSQYYPSDYPEPESIVYLKRNGFKIMEIPVKMNERLGGVSSIRSFRTLYYMIKVSLAIIIDVLRKSPQKEF